MRSSNRFCGSHREMVLLTEDEAQRPDSQAVAREKLRLQLAGEDPVALRDLAAWHKQHPAVPLAVAV